MMRRNRHAGFSLIELSIGIVVIAVLLGGILVPLRSQVETRNIEETQRMLAQAREALLGYVVANGYFPCPADDDSSGAESLPPDPPGPAPHDSANGTCGIKTDPSLDAGGAAAVRAFHGFLPARSLGLAPVDDRGFGIDAWGIASNRIRYSIYADAGMIGQSLVRSGGMAALGIPALGGATLFNVCLSGNGVGAADCGAGGPPGQVTLATNAVAVIWSVGGRSVPDGVHETENLDRDRVFVSRTRADVTGSGFDDIVTWIPMTVVISRMVAAGQLP